MPGLKERIFFLPSFSLPSSFTSCVSQSSCASVSFGRGGCLTECSVREEEERGKRELHRYKKKKKKTAHSPNSLERSPSLSPASLSLTWSGDWWWWRRRWQRGEEDKGKERRRKKEAAAVEKEKSCLFLLQFACGGRSESTFAPALFERASFSVLTTVLFYPPGEAGAQASVVLILSGASISSGSSEVPKRRLLSVNISH